MWVGALKQKPSGGHWCALFLCGFWGGRALLPDDPARQRGEMRQGGGARPDASAPLLPATHFFHRQQRRNPNFSQLCLVDYRSPIFVETCWSYFGHRKRDMLPENSGMSKSTCGGHLGENGINARPRQQPSAHWPAPFYILPFSVIKYAISHL